MLNGALAGPALRAFNQIAEAWSLTELEQRAILGQSVDAAFAVIGAGDVHASTWNVATALLAKVSLSRKVVSNCLIVPATSPTSLARIRKLCSTPSKALAVESSW